MVGYIPAPRLPEPDAIRQALGRLVASDAVRTATAGDIGDGLRAVAGALVRFVAALPPPARVLALAVLLTTALAGLLGLWSAARRGLRASVGALALAAVLVVGAGMAAAPGPMAAAPGQHAGSTDDAGPRGGRALLLLLRSLGVRAAQLERPWPPPGPGALVVLAPEEPPGPGEWPALDDWVRKGGRLVVALGTGPLGQTFGLEGSLGLELREVEVYGRVRTRLADESYEVELPAGRVLAGADWQPMISAGRGALCVRRPQGTGEMIACAGAFAFSNDGLGAADDAVF